MTLALLAIGILIGYLLARNTKTVPYEHPDESR